MRKHYFCVYMQNEKTFFRKENWIKPKFEKSKRRQSIFYIVFKTNKECLWCNSIIRNIKSMIFYLFANTEGKI